jgi:ATP-dependent Clp protease adaptor protein ClpS
MMFHFSDTEICTEEEVAQLTETNRGYSLVVWNDDVNTFDWVITTLIEICEHTPEQAEQCALLIHLTGKYAVKNGSMEVLKPRCRAITDRSIQATIEPVR